MVVIMCSNDCSPNRYDSWLTFMTAVTKETQTRNDNRYLVLWIKNIYSLQQEELTFWKCTLNAGHPKITRALSIERRDRARTMWMNMKVRGQANC